MSWRHSLIYSDHRLQLQHKYNLNIIDTLKLTIKGQDVVLRQPFTNASLQIR